ncbi:MAG: response regulator [Deltaproteobacteria bacterium]|nr:response regulator [Deltaproteobacteria bacterium]
MSSLNKSTIPSPEPFEANLEIKIKKLEETLSRYQDSLNREINEKVLLNEVLESLQNGIIITDYKGAITYINSALIDITGYKKEDLIGRPLFNFTNSNGSKIINTRLLPSLQKEGKWQGEFPIVKADSSVFTSVLTSKIVESNSKHGDSIITFFQDNAIIRQLEEQLRQSQKMEAIGTLAGGIAHDMNNVLSTIFNIGNVMKIELANYNESTKQDIEDILYAARRGRDLSRDLLGFARKGKYLKQRLNLNAIIEDITKLLHKTVNTSNIEIQMIPDESLLYIEGDSGQLSHAIMNLCINAKDAIGETGGTITITTKNIKLDGVDLLAWPQLTTGRYIRVDVIDDGEGMSEEVLHRVFEPFYSTKEKDKGTGLGLAMVYGTIQNHGGGINVKSKKGVGTQVTILLPVSKDSSAPIHHPTGTFKVSLTKGEGKVLLVDDEKMIRRSAGRLITKLGYDVIDASNGVEAMEILESQEHFFSIVILDLIMPVMNGEETFKRIKQFEPALPILISSGYSQDDKVNQLIQGGAAGFIQKPYGMTALNDAIKEFMRY